MSWICKKDPFHCGKTKWINGELYWCSKECQQSQVRKSDEKKNELQT
jgi:hypothetical protein